MRSDRSCTVVGHVHNGKRQEWLVQVEQELMWSRRRFHCFGVVQLEASSSSCRSFSSPCSWLGEEHPRSCNRQTELFVGACARPTAAFAFMPAATSTSMCCCASCCQLTRLLPTSAVTAKDSDDFLSQCTGVLVHVLIARSFAEDRWRGTMRVHCNS